MILIYICVVIFILIIILTALHKSLEKKIVYKNLKNRHVVITGGSSGIGKSAAIEAVKLGANVTIIGRDSQKLLSAFGDITRHCKLLSGQKVNYISLDITSDYDSIEKCLSKAESDIGPIFMLINCAGMCICGKFENMKVEHIKQMIDLNYFGTAYPTRYVLPGMKKRNEGLIVFVSTEAALLGIYGYSAYGAAKWAVRGLAESVFMELIGTNVRLTLAFPPDTDTPGFKNEELTKPKETKLISGSGGLRTPKEVGRKMIRDALNGKIYSVFGFSGHLLSILYCGTIDNLTQVLLQIFSMGILKAIMVGVQLSFHKIVRDGLKEYKVNENDKEKSL
ncbi:3-ketodihydrosphingosine reductase isoform X3 [Nymphalis io]|uniref:3-ketodihydrosphingosine reductase isoform X1 n=1 Tax=Inachis io TaxID=171585 RepID=UPI002167082B|nr:3-ketodihydrosphingosine reductase isoform X1 [Nymphalis io]XP_050348452.1 3-ketodihydrosphingosine reductase isoform X3 [Nymphalis io]